MPVTFPFTKTLIVSYKPLGWKLYLHVNFFKLPSQKNVVIDLEIEILLKKCICQERELVDNSKKALTDIFLTIPKISLNVIKRKTCS